MSFVYFSYCVVWMITPEADLNGGKFFSGYQQIIINLNKVIKKKKNIKHEMTSKFKIIHRYLELYVAWYLSLDKKKASDNN